MGVSPLGEEKTISCPIGWGLICRFYFADQSQAVMRDHVGNDTKSQDRIWKGVQFQHGNVTNLETFSKMRFFVFECVMIFKSQEVKVPFINGSVVLVSV